MRLNPVSHSTTKHRTPVLLIYRKPKAGQGSGLRATSPDCHALPLAGVAGFCQRVAWAGGEAGGALGAGLDVGRGLVVKLHNRGIIPIYISS